MKFVSVLLVALMAFVPAASLWPDAAHAQQGNPGTAAQRVGQQRAGGLTVPVTGTAGDAGPFVGTFTIREFAVQGSEVVALGTLVGTVDGATIVTPIAMPVVRDATATARAAAADVTAQATCPILNLVLGPLHLDLLGLVIDLNQVELEITAEQGPGNLLGNLLCAIAGLLDGPASPLSGLAALLNRLLGALG